MNIQLNKDQLYRVVIKWLNLYYGNLKPNKYKNFSNKVFYLNSDHEFVMEYNQKQGFVFISNEHIWSKPKSIFHLEEDDERPILKAWLKETYNLDNITPVVDLLS